MGRTKLEKEIADILELPTNEFTFYRHGKSLVYSLYVHYKHFDQWANSYSNEKKLMKIGSYLLKALGIERTFQEDNTYVEVHLKGKGRAIELYKFDYTHCRFIDETTISFCEWEWFN
jgi:predicted GNAT family acetyltransferase